MTNLKSLSRPNRILKTNDPTSRLLSLTHRKRKKEKKNDKKFHNVPINYTNLFFIRLPVIIAKKKKFQPLHISSLQSIIWRVKHGPQIDVWPAFNLVDRVTNNPFQERMRKPRDTQDARLPQINKIIPRPPINPWTEPPRSVARIEADRASSSLSPCAARFPSSK